MTGEQILKAAETLKKYKEKSWSSTTTPAPLSASARRQLAAQGLRRPSICAAGLAAWRAENLPLRRACEGARDASRRFRCMQRAGAHTATRARQLLNAEGVQFEEIDVDARPRRARR